MANYRTLSARKPRGRGHERRDEILAAAEAQIGRGGVEVSMREIATAAGVSQASLFKHFPNRPSLIGALRARVHARLEDRIGPPPDEPADLRASLDVILRAHAALAREQPPIFSLAFPTNGEIAPREGGAALPGMVRLRTALPGAMERSSRGLTREVVSLASWFSIYGMAATVALELGRDRGGGEELISGFLDLLVRQFGAFA